MSNTLVSILLVEDDNVDVMNVHRAFRKNNILNPLVTAKHGLEALNMLRGEGGFQSLNPKPNIILLDLNMPQMNGIEFLKELRQDDKLKSTSVFVMTTSKNEQDRVEAYNLNVAGYIIKPISFEKFVTAVSILKSYWQLCEQPS